MPTHAPARAVFRIPFANCWLQSSSCTRARITSYLAATFVLNSSIYFLAVDSNFPRRVDGQADPTLAYVHDSQLDIGANHNPFARFSAQD
jgi:hypothetical protein